MSKQAFYDELNRDFAALIAAESSFLAVMGNCSALLFERLSEVNWAGFYLLTEPDTLVLGPFQGKIACVRIPVGRGVCITGNMSGKGMNICNPLHGIFCNSCTANTTTNRNSHTGYFALKRPEDQCIRFGQ